MLNFNNVKVCEKYIRDSLRDVGLVFKRQGQFYVITDRKTKEVIISNANASRPSIEQASILCCQN